MNKIIMIICCVIMDFGLIFGEVQETYTQEEIDLIARIVMNEAGYSSIDEKQLVAETILNRVDSDLFPDTVKDVIYQPGQFYTLYVREPDDNCYIAVRNAITYRAFPRDMLYFRNDHVDYGYFYTQFPGSKLVFSTLNDYNNLGGDHE